jgi:hypothetical protein
MDATGEKRCICAWLVKTTVIVMEKIYSMTLLLLIVVMNARKFMTKIFTLTMIITMIKNSNASRLELAQTVL